MARTIGSKNKPKTPFPVKITELQKLKNLIARQDDIIAQMQDDLKQEQQKTEKMGQDIQDLEDDIESWREVLKTVLEIT